MKYQVVSLILCLAAAISNSETRTPDYLILGGELGNSSASSIDDIRSQFPKLKEMGLNTVLMPAYWELIEPEEGNFDFSLLDEAIDCAKMNDLKLVILWFGAWKNSMSCYAPSWVKTNSERFPRAITKEGKPLEILSAFSPDVLEADFKAFKAMISHFSKNDADSTVVMIQIENEIGMLESARDHSPSADQAYALGVPRQLAGVLGVNSGTPWNALCSEEDLSDEMFMAWHYAQYVERLAEEARKQLPEVPLYVNAAMDSRGRRPGQYPSAGPLAKLEKIWKTASPSIDFISPDLYDPPFKPWFRQYALPDNPLFIPEIRRSEDSGVHAFYAVGEHGAIGFSPFSIENANQKEKERLKSAYSLLEKIVPLAKGKTTYGLLFEDPDKKVPTIITDGDINITASHYFTLPWDKRATDGSPWPDGGGMIIKLSEGEYLIAGSGIVVKFETAGELEEEKNLGEDGFLLSGENESAKTWKGKHRIGILNCDEVEIDTQGNINRIRRLNGDETHQGRHVRIGPDGFCALRVKTYKY